MSAMASQIKDIKTLDLLAFYDKNPLVTNGFPQQIASNAERVSMSWCRHAPLGIVQDSGQSQCHNWCAASLQIQILLV